ncbi:ABC transporter ATP-binding protein [Lederbergia citrea]|uniref:ABC transporter ATP-binding protein n=1 Tax=Lederbergia citrea TaxID=2833581 RepID=UPI001BC9A023|nr:ABC transporter ATP-binding protein [Lederbergia citrea]MBS4177724.1 ABC transporter ATP-binding protein [Lederbergia citrea]MBS4204400.1 ABC transporter ATP-binding protein [Lederbergia citrea]
MEKQIVLEAANIKKVFGSKGNIHTVLDEVDLDVYEGEFVGIMGPSGAGKSTLLNVLSTIDVPTSGEIKIDRQSILKLKEEDLADFRRDKLGFIFQDYNLIETLTVKENIILPLSLANVSHQEIENRIKKVSMALGIEGILHSYPYHISGGEQQRTATARAIITNPSLIFADEPTGALDSKSAFMLLGTLAELNQREKATILMVTHDAYAASFSSRVLFIKDGSIFTEIRKGEQSRKHFFEQIIDILATLGGGGHHDVI